MASIPALSSLLITLPRAFHDLAVVGQNLTLPSNNLAFCLANASRFIRWIRQCAIVPMHHPDSIVVSVASIGDY